MCALGRETEHTGDVYVHVERMAVSRRSGSTALIGRSTVPEI
jgi:hypothetical protein